MNKKLIIKKKTVFKMKSKNFSEIGGEDITVTGATITQSWTSSLL